MNLINEYKNYLLGLRSFWIFWVLTEILSLYFLSRQIASVNLENPMAVYSGQTAVAWLKFALTLGIVFLLRKEMDPENPVPGKDYFLFLLRYAAFGIGIILCLAISAFFIILGITVAGLANWNPQGLDSSSLGGLIAKYSLLFGILVSPFIVWILSAQIASIQILPGLKNLISAIRDFEFRKSLLWNIGFAAIGTFFAYYVIGIQRILENAGDISVQAVNLTELYLNSGWKFYTIDIFNSFYVLFYGFSIFAYVRRIQGFKKEEPESEE